jgi:hypothetical protein
MKKRNESGHVLFSDGRAKRVKDRNESLTTLSLPGYEKAGNGYSKVGDVVLIELTEPGNRLIHPGQAVCVYPLMFGGILLRKIPKAKRKIDFTKYKLRTCTSMHECSVCHKKIGLGDEYYDGGYGRRAHKDCAEAKGDGRTGE